MIRVTQRGLHTLSIQRPGFWPWVPHTWGVAWEGLNFLWHINCLEMRAVFLASKQFLFRGLGATICWCGQSSYIPCWCLELRTNFSPWRQLTSWTPELVNRNPVKTGKRHILLTASRNSIVHMEKVQLRGSGPIPSGSPYWRWLLGYRFGQVCICMSFHTCSAPTVGVLAKVCQNKVYLIFAV